MSVDSRFDAVLRRVAALPGPGIDHELIGKRVGPYEIESVLGAGGMGVVYRGRDALLGRPAAIKLLPSNIHDETRHSGKVPKRALPEILPRIHRTDSDARNNVIQVVAI